MKKQHDPSSKISNPQMPDVYLKVPRAGLANQILVWAHAFVFARQTKGTLYESSWSKFSIGPFLRNERSKRWYLGMIKAGKSLPVLKRFKPRQIVPKSDWTGSEFPANCLIQFSEVPHHEHYFDLIRDSRETLKSAFLAKIRSGFQDTDLVQLPVAIHIRLGDFVLMPWYKPKWDYYRKLILELRKITGSHVPITVFSDGRPQEIPILDEFENMAFYTSGNDLTDLLTMANSNLLFTFAGSTFSLWAAFISDKFVAHMNDYRVRHHDDPDAKREVKSFDEADQLNPELVGVLMELSSQT